jgi:hypothetical protein
MLQWLGTNHRNRGLWLVRIAMRIKAVHNEYKEMRWLEEITNIDEEGLGLMSRTIYYVGMFGGFALAAVVLTYKPDTR